MAAVPQGVPSGAHAALVAGIIDGDTIEVRVEQPGALSRGSHTLRLLEIDTPETVHPTVGVECYGPEASAFAAREMPVGSQAWLLADQEDQDQYDRYLRYVWTDDGTFIGSTPPTGVVAL